MAAVQREYFEGPEGASTLVVLIHGLRGRPAGMAGLARAAREAVPGAATYIPRMCYSSSLSRVAPEQAASALLEEVDTLVGEGEYRNVVVVGYSMGSLIARKLIVLAHGESPDTPFESGLEQWRKPRPWAGKIDRLVLAAGISRGWSNNAAHGALEAMGWSLGALLGDVLFNGRLTVLQTRAGSPFVVQTRLQWLALMRRVDAPRLVTVQLLGSVDDTVAPEDTADLLTEIAEGRFVMLQLPKTNHMQAVEVEGSDVAEDRRSRFMAALALSPPELNRTEFAVPVKYVTNGPPPVASTGIDDVVFVIHGIRDRGFWTQKIAHKVMAEAERNGRTARSMTLSYGYLAMGPFFLPWVRREKVRWLMDRYADCRALYPQADFHYVGHSNGTYLAARALVDYPAARFRRVVFAGSVVRCDYDWNERITGARRQVEAVLNYVASGDWVVAIFPNGVARFRALDLGGAGHHGFDALRDGNTVRRASGARISTVPFAVAAAASHQVDYVAGGHGAGIKESQWDDIAKFVICGTPPSATDPDFVDRQRGWVRASAWLPPAAFAVVVLAALVVLGALIYLAAWLGTRLTGAAVGGWAAGALAALVSLALVRLVVTRL